MFYVICSITRWKKYHPSLGYYNWEEIPKDGGGYAWACPAEIIAGILDLHDIQPEEVWQDFFNKESEKLYHMLEFFGKKSYEEAVISIREEIIPFVNEVKGKKNG